MSLVNEHHEEHALELCIDELGEALRALDHFPPTVVAVALRTHLETLLQALLEGGVCSHAEVRDYLREFEREVLQYQP
ncbi:MAG: hypothetical protein JSS29_14020 [Proteobacteria bacterium]|nr:hypothetical protein [Pseudomonadota bacterium]